MALAALQIRMNVSGRGSGDVNFVEFNSLDSAREGCNICSLDFTCASDDWEKAIISTVSAIHKLGKYGVTNSELQRYSSALLTDAQQLFSMESMVEGGDVGMSSNEILAGLMQTVSSTHQYMSAEESLVCTEAALTSLTVDDVGKAAAELSNHILNLANPKDGLDNELITVIAW